MTVHIHGARKAPCGYHGERRIVDFHAEDSTDAARMTPERVWL